MPKKKVVKPEKKVLSDNETLRLWGFNSSKLSLETKQSILKEIKNKTIQLEL